MFKHDDSLAEHEPQPGAEQPDWGVEETFEDSGRLLLEIECSHRPKVTERGTMARIQVSIDIPQPPEVVWADIEQLETHVEWMADAESIDFEGEQRRGVGTTMNVLTRVGPLTTTDVIRIVDWDPPRSMAVVHEGLVTGEGEFTLEPLSTGTRFLWAEELTMPWYFGGPLGGLVARPVLAWVWRRNLKRLAARFE